MGVTIIQQQMGLVHRVALALSCCLAHDTWLAGLQSGHDQALKLVGRFQLAVWGTNSNQEVTVRGSPFRAN